MYGDITIVLVQTDSLLDYNRRKLRIQMVSTTSNVFARNYIHNGQVVSAVDLIFQRI